MMNLRRTVSTYGRLVVRPDSEQRQAEAVFEENVTLQDQIEGLRTKISLKERYNKVQREEVDECKEGGNVVLYNLWSETQKLRTQLMTALNAERQAVHNALRSHREFQLALKGKVPAFAVDWLRDKLFNMTKRMNNLLHSLACKRQKLKNAEDLIRIFETAPRPGSTKWEQETISQCRKLEYDIDNMKVKCETANILFSKYKEIKNILLAEKGRYAPTLRMLENQMLTQRRELEHLKKMLSEAIVFQNDAVRNLELTEKEASENRRRRRHQMAKMKKAVQKILQENLAVVSTPTDARGDAKKSHAVESGLKGMSDHGSDAGDSNALLRMRKLEVERYQDKARRLVDCMRVPDLTYIPERLRTVKCLSDRLQQDKSVKEKRRDFMLRQRDQLLLIHSYMSYTGQKTELEFRTTEETLLASIKNVEESIGDKMKKVEQYGAITNDVRLGLISILELLHEGAAKRKQPALDNLKELLKLVNAKVFKLTTEVQELEKQVGAEAEVADLEALKWYAQSTPVPNRLIRVGTPNKDRDSDDDDYDDIKVPTRHEIKSKSARLVATGMLTRGVVR